MGINFSTHLDLRMIEEEYKTQAIMKTYLIQQFLKFGPGEQLPEVNGSRRTDKKEFNSLLSKEIY